jgi:nucleoid DNA-binding protein
MNITRSQLVKKISERSGFYQKDVDKVLKCFDDVVFDCLCEATLDEEIQVQVVTGIKVGCKKLPQRDRVDPRTQEPIIVDESPKLFTKFSQDFKLKVFNEYESKNGG